VADAVRNAPVATDPPAPRTPQLTCRFCRNEWLSDSSAATSWQAAGASRGRPTYVGSDSSKYDNVDRSAKPRSGGATFVVVVQAADVWNGDDPGLQSMHRPLEIAVVYASATGRRLGEFGFLRPSQDGAQDSGEVLDDIFTTGHAPRSAMETGRFEFLVGTGVESCCPIP
jgi:hypothetical protein